jgi:hypothetical protein
LCALPLLFSLLLSASPFAPLVEQDAQWRYAAYAEDAKGKRTDETAPGELRLRVALVREVGRFTLVALQPLIDGVEAERIRNDMDLTFSFGAPARVFALSPAGLRSVALDLETARTADDAAIEAAATDEPVIFPATSVRWSHQWTHDEEQLSHHATGKLAVTHEMIGGESAEVWNVTWKGKACFAGECRPFVATQAYAPGVGFVRLCTLSLVDAAPMHCLKLLSKEQKPAEDKPGAPPTLGGIYRTMMQAKDAVTACLPDNGIASLGFTVNADGTLSNIKEKNQSGEAAKCTVSALAQVHFSPFQGKPRTVELLSFAK